MRERKPALEDKKNIASQIYDSIKRDIAELRLEPGAPFLEKEVAERLGTSRTPVREAAKRLEQEGWIVWESYRKARVKDISLENALEIFELRKMIEPFCIDRVFQNGRARVLAGKLDAIAMEMESLQDDWVRFLRADVTFHTAIVTETENAHLQRIWLNLSTEINRIAIFPGEDRQRDTSHIINEHREILQALWDMDKERVLRRLTMHHDAIFSALERKLTDHGWNAS